MAQQDNRNPNIKPQPGKINVAQQPQKEIKSSSSNFSGKPQQKGSPQGEKKNPASQPHLRNS